MSHRRNLPAFVTHLPGARAVAVFLLALGLPVFAQARTVAVQWRPPTDATGITGFRFYASPAAGGQSYGAGAVAQISTSQATVGAGGVLSYNVEVGNADPVFVVMTAINSNTSEESDFSNQIRYTGATPSPTPDPEPTPTPTPSPIGVPGKPYIVP